MIFLAWDWFVPRELAQLSFKQWHRSGFGWQEHVPIKVSLGNSPENFSRPMILLSLSGSENSSSCPRRKSLSKVRLAGRTVPKPSSESTESKGSWLNTAAMASTGRRSCNLTYVCIFVCKWAIPVLTFVIMPVDINVCIYYYYCIYFLLWYILFY